MTSARRADLLRQIEVAQRDLANAELQIEKWETTRQRHSNEIDQLKSEIAALDTHDERQIETGSLTLDSVDYMRQEFQWSKQLKSKLKRIFGIDDFRLCQKGCVARVECMLLGFTLQLAESVTQTFTRETSSASCQQEGGRV